MVRHGIWKKSELFSNENVHLWECKPYLEVNKKETVTITYGLAFWLVLLLSKFLIKNTVVQILLIERTIWRKLKDGIWIALTHLYCCDAKRSEELVVQVNGLLVNLHPSLNILKEETNYEQCSNSVRTISCDIFWLTREKHFKTSLILCISSNKIVIGVWSL